VKWIFLMLAACGDGGASSVDSGTVALTLDNCTTTIAPDVPEPYRSMFRCVDLALDGDDLVITTSGLPPHPTYYYGDGNPNFVAWDTRGGIYAPNPNRLSSRTVSIALPLAPISRGLTIGEPMIDGKAKTSVHEYRGGPAGVALDSVMLFAAFAAPGADLSVEMYTFDEYNAHPSPAGDYHYHRDTPGPIGVLDAYGIMCDGTFVFGCTELGGTPADLTDVDAQNGHAHDVGTIPARYHVHICPSSTHPRPYTPEIQFYDRCTIR
jgi:hypothetical protein